MFRPTTLALAALLLAGCGSMPRAPQAAQAGAFGALARREAVALTRMTAACMTGMRQIFESIDRDDDGRVTRAEWDARCLDAEWWASCDLDADGVLEFHEFAPAEAMRSFAKRILQECDDELAEFDANGDGVIEGPELEGDGAVMRVFDADHDGRVVLREIQAFWESFMSGESSTIIWPACPAPANGYAGREGRGFRWSLATQSRLPHPRERSPR